MKTVPQEILDMLPHRPPFRYISAVQHLDPGVSGEATWELHGDEPFFSGHFPGQPIVPGVLIAEALAQLSGLVTRAVEVSAYNPELPEVAAPLPVGKLAHVDVRFHHVAVPPVTIRLKSIFLNRLGTLYQFEVYAFVGDQMASKGRISLVFGEPENGK